MNELFFKSFVIPFYRAFLGFFILVIVVFGVFMELKQHLRIAERVLQSPVSFYPILLVFLVYSVAQQRFLFRLLNDKRYRVFHDLGFLSWSQLGRNFLPVWLANHVLVLCYSVLLTYVGLGAKAGEKLGILWLLLIVIFLAEVTLLHSKIKKPFPDFIRVRTRLFKKLGVEFWFLMYLKEKRTLLLLAVKLVSIILLNGFFYFYYDGGYDLRWLEFGLLCAAYVHFPLWLEKHSFESRQLTYFHAMPISYWMKLGQHSKTLIIILLPELVLMVYKFGNRENLANLFFLLVLFIALNMGMYGLVKWRNGLANSLNSAYLIFFMLFLLVIFGIHPLIISTLCMVPFFTSLRPNYSV